jgi:hypothetical protein
MVRPAAKCTTETLLILAVLPARQPPRWSATPAPPLTPVRATRPRLSAARAGSPRPRRLSARSVCPLASLFSTECFEHGWPLQRTHSHRRMLPSRFPCSLPAAGHPGAVRGCGHMQPGRHPGLWRELRRAMRPVREPHGCGEQFVQYVYVRRRRPAECHGPAHMQSWYVPLESVE